MSFMVPGHNVHSDGHLICQKGSHFSVPDFILHVGNLEAEHQAVIRS